MLIDTNILISYINGDTLAMEALSSWKQEGKALFISSVTVTEVLSYPPLTVSEIDDAKEFLAGFVAIDFDTELAEIAAFLRRAYRLSTPDAAIAATAILHRLPLVTRDKQFVRIKELLVVSI